MPFLFLIPVVMFFSWRAWLEMRGEEWKPSATWDSWTADSERYLDSLPPRSRKQKVQQVWVFLFSVSLVGSFIAWVAWVHFTR